MRRTLSLFLLLIILTGCRPAPTPEPAFTPMPTFTLAPTATEAPTATPAATPSPSEDFSAYPCAETSQAEAVSAIRALLDRPDLALTFRLAENSVFNHTHRLAVFEDLEMTEYRVDCASGQVVEALRKTAVSPGPERPPAAELETAALELVGRGAPDLDPAKLQPEAASKGGTLFFRWTGEQILTDPPGGMLAFIEAAYHPSGVLVHYTNLFPLVPED